jgi:predicted nucleotidyltransferase
VAQRLERIYSVAVGTGQLARFVVFGSFVTAKREPADIDVFLLMEDTFDMGRLTGEARVLFDHAAAQAHLASVFWLRRLAALGGEEQAIAGWQIKRDGTSRGIIEIIEEQT